MKTLYIFMLVVAVLLSIDALPFVPSNKVTIPLKKKPITHRRAHKLDRRVTNNVDVFQQEPDKAYFGEFTFGKAKSGDEQTFEIQFDTGSADLWVIGIDCKSPACDEKPVYDKTFDTDYIELDESFNIKYADGGEASGWQGTTIIKIGDLSVRQKFGSVDELTDNFQKDEFQGIMGMAFNVASQNDQITLMSNLFNDETHGFDAKQFSFKFGRSPDDPDGELTIGGTNPKSYTGMITWTDLSAINNGLWIIPLDDCLVNGKALNLVNRVANVDTGTTLIAVSHDDALQVYANIDHEERDGLFYISCDRNDQISLRINGGTWNIDPRDFVIENGDECYGAIEVIDTAVPNEWLLGTAFLKNVYSVFDLGNLQVGFAQLA